MVCQITIKIDIIKLYSVKKKKLILTLYMTAKLSPNHQNIIQEINFQVKLTSKICIALASLRQ